ncbi:MAG TPA: carboxypeptidase regulatory-like domain-containing protein, partial [Planctomycetota bacterium]|nr:carboxypeptidase regulatory-like domain-containing protein [Planctomycetota bacterium]
GVNRDAHVFLTVTHPEHGTKWESRQGSDLENGVEIVLEPARAIGGRVIDSSGEPVAGALVELKIPGVPEIFLRMRGSTPLASRSDEDGRFALPVTPGPPSGKITIEATRAGLGIGQVDLEMKDGEEPPEVEIILERPRSITGRVTDLSGQPIAGARVSVRRAVELTGEVAMMALLLPQSEGIVAYSREDGSFTASNLAPGIYDVEAIAARFAKKTLEDVAVEGEETQLEISLDPGGTIRGRVVDHTGEPLAGVEVAATIDHLSERGVGSEGPADRAIREFGQPNAAAVASMTTPASGRFELTHLPDRALCIVARKPGHELAVLSDVRGDESIPDIVLRPFASLTVKVVDAATRLPIPTIELSINGGAARSGQGGWDRYREPFASADGIYTLSELYSGTYTVTVQANGYAQVRRAIALEPGASETMTLELAPGLELAGVVRTSDGQPVPSAHITLYPQENDPGLAPRPHYEAICGTDGSFVVGGLDAARYVVSASHPDYFVESAPDAIVLTESGVEPIEIVVSPAGRLSGTLPIPGSDGQRQVMVELALLPDDRADGDGASERRESEATESPRITSSAWVDARRRFQAISLRPGRYAATIVIYDHSAAAQSRPSEERLPAGEVDVVVGETKEIDLEPR